MAVNDRVRENPRFNRMPRTEAEWAAYNLELTRWVLRAARLGDGSLTDASGTTINGLDEMPGTVASERSIPMVLTGNGGSLMMSSPLTATDAGASATVSVAAFTLYTSQGNISYNAGSITGLTHATTYYIYADDDYAGGTVTYSASTTQTDLVANVNRLFVGNVTTPAAASTEGVTGITNANPCVVTVSSAHGRATGDEVTITGIVDNGPNGDLESQLNGNPFTLTVLTSTTFSLDTDTSGLTNTYVSGGSCSFSTPAQSGGPSGGGGGWGGGYEDP